MIGSSGIPELRLSTLNKLITKFDTSPNLVLMTMFGSDQQASDTIKWESQIGNRGLTPFVAPDAPSPSVGMEGVAKHEASAAYWKEKIWFSESFLNNLRAPGTVQEKQRAQVTLAKENRKLRNRCDRRKEWMFAKMLTAGSIAYKDKDSQIVNVDYGIPSANQVSLAAARHWDTGESRNIVEDIMDANITMSNNNGSKLGVAMCTSEILKLMILDTSIQTILQKSSFGSGDLFANPRQVLAGLLQFENFFIYDEQYQIRAWLTAAVTGDSTTAISVEESTDFEAGGTLTFVDTSARTTESETIASVAEQSGTVTVATAPTASFKATEDYVYMTKKFLPTDKFCMFTPRVEGMPIAEFMEAPFGLDGRYGMFVDTEPSWDPDGVHERVQNKGLPVLYHEDAPYILTVLS